MQTDFLSALRRRKFRGQEDEGPAEEFFFQIAYDGNDGALVRLVDSEGRRLMPRGHVSEPAVAAALGLFRDSGISLKGWSGSHTELSLAGKPQLPFMLMLCPNVVDKDMRRISYDPAPVSPVLVLTQEGDTVTPLLLAEVGGGERRPFVFLTDSLVLIGTVMSPCRPVGVNFRYASSLLSPFDVSISVSYLSVVLSSLTNIHVDFGGRKVVESKEEAVTLQPGLFFEKVDFDKALFLRVLSVVPGIPPELTADFEINTVASFTDDTLYLHHVSVPDPAAVIDDFSTLLDDTFRTQKDRNAIFRDGSLFVFPQKQASEFLIRMLPRLLQEYSIFGAGKLKEFKINTSLPRLEVRLGSGIDFLEGEVAVDFGGESMSLGEFLRQYHRSRYIELSDGTRNIIDEAYIKRLERIFRPVKNSGNPAAVEVSFFDIPGLEQLLGVSDRPEFAHSRKFYEGLRALPEQHYETPEIRGELRPYQKEGVKWMEYLGENGFGACLADDMGLGKTIQAIALILKICARGNTLPVLVVMPRSLLFNWKAELARFAPELRTYVYHGIARDFNEAIKSQVMLTTYAMVRNDIRRFLDAGFEYVILDESQNIKNITAQTTRAVMALDTRHRLALSGTPMENNLHEIYSLFRFLNPGMFGSVEEFNLRYAVPIQRENDREAMDALRRKIFPFIMRRLKRDVLDDLPERVDQTLYVEMEPEHRRFYEQRRRHYKELVKATIISEGLPRSQFVMLKALSELRRIASVPECFSDGAIRSPKLELLVEQVSQSVENGHKVVVFFNFIAGLELAATQLRQAGIGALTMTGSTANREEVVKRFQSDPASSVLLMTVKVGGVGLNLTAADIVYIFEPWWNKAAEEQAVNRLHRIGQKATVFTFSMITHATIEEKIRQLQEQKAALFDELISADSSMSKSLTEEDINFILS